MKYMKSKALLIGFSSLIGVIDASTLNIYSNKSIYEYIPTDRYIGFASNIDIKCEGKSIDTFNDTECEKNNNLCKEYKTISNLTKELAQERYRINTLNTITKGLNINTLNANSIIDTSKVLAKEYVSLKESIKTESLKLKNHQQKFKSMTTSAYPLYMESDCKRDFKITLPSSYVGAKFIQKATIDDKNLIKIERFISLYNRSGIDIIAKKANIHFQTYQTKTQIPHFSPWLLSARTNIIYRQSKRLAIAPTAMPRIETHIGKALKKGFRDYSVSDLILPSDGKEYEHKIYTQSVPVVCEERAYTYLSPSVYNICSFKSSTPVEENSWEIITPKGNKIYTEGRYEDGKYLLDTGIDESIKIRKNRLPSKDRKSGFFGSDIKKTDGYIITLANRTKESKSITLIDRIPYSKSDKIRVTLDSVSGAESKKVTKYGKLTLRVNLKPLENRTVKVVFSMRYDKKLHPSY